MDKGFGEAVRAQNFPASTEVKTERSTIASSRKEGFSQSITSEHYLARTHYSEAHHHQGRWKASKLQNGIGSISLPCFMSNRGSLRVPGCMGVTEVPKLETFPEGFPRLACFLDSDDSFMLFKRFGTVFSRLLLNKQDEIRRMEAELLGMDKTDEKYGGGLYLKSPYEDTPELLLKAHQLKSLEKPSARDYRSVIHYMENDGGQTYEKEMSWQGGPGITSARKRTRLARRHARAPSEALQGPTRTILLLHTTNTPRKETNARTENPAIHYYDRRRISQCVTFLITILILILLMTPIWLLYKSSVHGTIGKTSDTIVLILAFTLIFSAALSALTKAKRHEIIAASPG
ncbi:MAG: hypothetical protein Q9182_002850 [Xanthomendoza sp. 2 TL-2023]